VGDIRFIRSECHRIICLLIKCFLELWYYEVLGTVITNGVKPDGVVEAESCLDSKQTEQSRYLSNEIGMVIAVDVMTRPAMSMDVDRGSR